MNYDLSRRKLYHLYTSVGLFFLQDSSSSDQLVDHQQKPLTVISGL